MRCLSLLQTLIYSWSSKPHHWMFLLLSWPNILRRTVTNVKWSWGVQLIRQRTLKFIEFSCGFAIEIFFMLSIFSPKSKMVQKWTRIKVNLFLWNSLKKVSVFT